MKYLTINNTVYGFAKDFKHNPELRSSFNRLTQKTYGFDLEYSYSKGYWSDNYIPNSLLLDDKIISNVSINIIEFLVNNEKKIGLQIGTVMTDVAHRNLGLNRFLMEEVLKEWKDKCDFMYLFANDTVLNFYPKFNFELVEEYQCSKEVHLSSVSSSFRELNIAIAEDKKLLEQYINDSVPISKIAMLNNPFLIMFYCTSNLQYSIYYSDELQTVVVADTEDNKTLFLYDIFTRESIDIDDVIEGIADKSTQKVVLGFTPLEDGGYNKSMLKPDDVLFVLKDHSNIFKNKKWMFPVLSHA